MLQILSKRSSCADKRPDPANLANGELAINFNSTSSNVYYKDNCGGLNLVGAASVTAIAPNSCATGYCGNTPGEFWFDCSNSALKIWNGACWFGISSGCSAGTVTTVIAGAGLTGGTINVSGTIALATTAVTAGTYSYACVAIDCYGRITSASCGSNPVCLSTITAKGDLIVGTGVGTISALPVGVNNYVLAADSACSTGVKWVVSDSGVAGVTGTAPVVIDNTDPANPVISVSAATPTVAGLVLGCTTASNSALGCDALLSNTTGLYNTASGRQALCYNTSGCFNSAFGTAALFYNTTGGCNIAVGYAALDNNTTGGCNIAVGTSALSNLTTGSQNVGIGPSVTVPSATGSCQLAIGFSASDNWLTGNSAKTIRPGAGIADCADSCGTDGQVLMSNGSNAVCWGAAASASAATPTVAGIVLGCTTATNSALGCYALLSNTTGVYNTAVGNEALFSNTTGDYNNALGRDALYYNTTGNSNTATGPNVLYYNTTGSYNTASGRDVLFSNTSGSYNIGFGYKPFLFNTTGNYNTAIGTCALYTNTTGCRNVAIGTCAIVPLDTGSCQLAIGFSTIDNWLTGDCTKAIKPGAGIIDCAGSCGTDGQVLMSNGSNAVCWGAAASASAATPTVAGIVLGLTNVNNAALGCNALLSNTGACNTALGRDALCFNTTGGYNTASGALSLKNNTIGVQNNAFGLNALRDNTTGGLNNAFGVNALLCNTTGCCNIASGNNALCVNTTGGLNVAVGVNALNSLTTGSQNVGIGPNACVPSATGSCQLAIGFSASDNWLTGNSAKTIRPGAGIADCADSCGTIGQVLMSNGSNAICWGTAAAAATCATPLVAGIVFGLTCFNNAALGCNALCSLTFGTNNAAIGCDAMRLNTTGSCNTGLGASALCKNTTGSCNTAVGTRAMDFNTTGICNTATGFNALRENLTGCCNTASGVCALFFQQTGDFNTASGVLALVKNQSGCNNSAFGVNALCANTTANSNSAFGVNALCANTIGGLNHAFGRDALCANTQGCHNSAFGNAALGNVTTGSQNVGIGLNVNVASGTGSCQLAIGFSASDNWLTGNSAKTIRPGAGIADCADSCGTIGQVLMSNGSNAICWGTAIQPSILTAKGSLISASAASTPTALAVGTEGQVLAVCSACTSGLTWTDVAVPVDQTPVGTVAFFAMSTAPTGWTVADGSCVSRTTYSQLFAAISTTYGAGDGSTTFQLPDLRGQFIRGWNGTALGIDPNRTFGSCQCWATERICGTICAISETFSGNGASAATSPLFKSSTTPTATFTPVSSDTSNAGTLGFDTCRISAERFNSVETRPANIAMLPCIKTGNSSVLSIDATPTIAGALLGCTTATNAALGCNAGAGTISTTFCLTAVGSNALCVATGNNNTAIGRSAGSTLTTGSNNTLIGFNSAPSVVTVSNEITLGNSSIATIRAQVTTITSLSDGRDKKFIRDIPIGLDFINNLRPVEFEWNMRDGGKVDEVDTGFIAQDLQEIQEELGYTLPGLVYEANPDRLEAGYGKLLPVLVKAIQELSEKNDALEAKIAALT